MQITKNIYYCWFGKQEKPSAFLNYLETWKKYLPDYKIIEINETNFDVSLYAYAKTAYEAKRYAFVSDCARIHFLQEFGGIYFDTDVEVRKSMEPLIKQNQAKILLSMEYFQYEITGVNTAVMISEPHCKMWQDLLTFYKTNDFISIAEPKTINMYISELLQKETSFQYKDKEQFLLYKSDEIAIIKSNNLMKNTESAYAVHHLEGSWTKNMSFTRRLRRIIGVTLKKVIGRSNFERLWNKK